MRPCLYTAAWVLPVSAPPLPAGGVLVDAAGRIAAVGPMAELSVGDDVSRIDLDEAILLPGLVNVHAHPELAAFRGLLEDLPFHDWIPALRRARLGAALTPAELRAAALWTCAESLAAGITCIGATEDSAAALEALAECGMRGVAFRETFAPDPAHAAGALAELQQRVAGMRRLESELVRVGVSPHAPYTVSDPLYRGVAEWSAAEALPVAVHAAEAEVETLLVARGEGPFAAGLRTRGIATPPRARSPIALLAETGILARAPLVIHGVQLDDADLAQLAAHGASLAHCPVANARLGHGVAPVAAALARGINVALGTDSVASNNRLDLLEEARSAQLLQRATLRSAGVLPGGQLLAMATVNGAQALGFGSRTGTLEPGRDADLCAVRLAGVHTQPVHDPLAALFFAARGTDVVLTAVRGRVLYRQGRWASIDVEALRTTLEETAPRLRRARDAR